jgi:uncharacterized protein
MRPEDTIDRLVHRAEDLVVEAGEIFDRHVRLGVTGLSRAGKTIFIASLVHHLLHPGRLPMVSVMAKGRYDTAILKPSTGGAVPRFPYETVLRSLIGSEERPPAWPDGTRSVSELRLSVRFDSPLLFGFTRPMTLHLDIVDYPGEWLLDLPLLGMDYATWSRQAWELAASGGRAALSAEWRTKTEALAASGRVDEISVIEAAAAFRRYLLAARDAPERYAMLQPGRFLMPGEMEGAPALTFFPLPDVEGRGARGSLMRLMSDRYDSYKRDVVEPFFRDNLQRIDRQVVLVDLLDHLAAGPESISDLKRALDGTLGAFRHGENSWLSFLLGRKIDKVLFAATKADHLHSKDHEQLRKLLASLVGETGRRLTFGGTVISTEAIAALRVTDETEIKTASGTWPGVGGLPLDSDHEEAVLPGTLPDRLEDLRRDGSLASVAFRPRPGDVLPDRGMRSLRFDRAVEFLLGDALA